MHVLVTGGTGLIGRNLVKRLEALKRQKDVRRALERERGVTVRTVRMDPATGTLDLDDLSYHRGPGSVAGPGTMLLQQHLEPPIE